VTEKRFKPGGRLVLRLADANVGFGGALMMSIVLLI